MKILKRILLIGFTVFVLFSYVSYVYADNLNSAALNPGATNDQYFSTADHADFEGTNLTLEAWLKVETAPASNDEDFIMGKTDVDNARAYAFRYYNISGTLSLALAISSDCSGQTSKAVTQTVTAGEWHHVAVVYTAAGGTADFYYDGQPTGAQQTGLPTSRCNGDAIFGIGNAETVPYPFLDAEIDEVRVWNTARTAVEIDANYDVELNGNETGLVAYYQMEPAAPLEDRGETTDPTGSAANDLTNNNSITFSTDVPFVDADPAAAATGRRRLIIVQ